jgi:hypothetical protein
LVEVRKASLDLIPHLPEYAQDLFRGTRRFGRVDEADVDSLSDFKGSGAVRIPDALSGGWASQW